MSFVGDPLAAAQPVVAEFLMRANGSSVQLDAIVHEDIHWRPHLFEPDLNRAWYLHFQVPETDSWFRRIRRARDDHPDLQVGVFAPINALMDDEFLRQCDRLGAALIPSGDGGEAAAEKIYSSVADFIIETRSQLSESCASDLLGRALQRALTDESQHRRGVLFEVVVALLLSQVRGFEVHDVGISNRSQQMDVLVQNRNTGGALAGSPVVLAEAKNWADPVTPTQYAEFVRKLQARHGRAKLGFLVTSSRFTEGVSLEVRRESMGDHLVVMIDGKSLPEIWSNSSTITQNIERLTLTATVGS